MNRIIFKINPWVLVALLFLPVLSLVVKADQPLLRYGPFLITYFVGFIWYWQINKAVNISSDKDKIFSVIISAAVIILLITELFWLEQKLQSRFYSMESDNEVLLFFKKSDLSVRSGLSLLISVLLTIRIRKILPERSVWFLFLELSTFVFAVINITPLIKEESSKEEILA